MRDCNPKDFAIPASLFEPHLSSLWSSMGCPVAAAGELYVNAAITLNTTYKTIPAAFMKNSGGFIKIHTLLTRWISPSRTATWCHRDTPAPTFAARRFCHINKSQALSCRSWQSGTRCLTHSLTLQVLTWLDWGAKTILTASNSYL